MLTALAFVGIGEDAQSRLFSHTNADADIAAAALVTSFGLLSIGCAQQQDVTLGGQSGVARHFKLTADNDNVTAVSSIALAGCSHLHIITGTEC